MKAPKFEGICIEVNDWNLELISQSINVIYLINYLFFQFLANNYHYISNKLHTNFCTVYPHLHLFLSCTVIQ